MTSLPVLDPVPDYSQMTVWYTERYDQTMTVRFFKMTSRSCGIGRKKWGMSFHSEKCSLLRVHRTPVIFNYSLKGHTLKCEESTKYLGVEISQDMSWVLHTDMTVKECNSALGFLRKNLQINSEDVKNAAFISLVRPQLRVLFNNLEFILR